MTIPVPALTTTAGSIHLTSELQATLQTAGAATNNASLAIRHGEANDCNHVVTLPIPAGASHVRLSLTIAPSDCPSLFRANPGTLQVTFGLASSTWSRMSSFDLVSQLRSVDVFFAEPGDVPLTGDGAQGA